MTVMPTTVLPQTLGTTALPTVYGAAPVQGAGTTDLFTMVDRNHDGKVTRSEFNSALSGHMIAPGQ